MNQSPCLTLILALGLGGGGLALSPVARAANCAGNLTNRADVFQSTPGNDYDVYYNNSTMSPDFFPAANAGWARDALFRSHHVFVNTNGFDAPRFSAAPNDTCIFAGAPCWANAPENRIQLSTCTSTLNEPFTRSVVNHELFHHVQYAYINFGDWPAWGGWAIEGTPPAMEDRSFADTDNNAANCRFVGDVNGFLGNPNVTLTDRNYDASLFWSYLAEQFGSVTSEPNRGVDVIRDFWARCRGNSPDSIRFVRDVIAARAPGRTFEDVFMDLAIACFTHDLNLSRLSSAQQRRYAFVDETAGGGGTAYNSVATTAVTSFNTTLSGSVVRWGARHFTVNVPEGGCQAVGFWGKARANKTLGWALVGVRGGNQVTEVIRGQGTEFYRAFLNNPVDRFTRMALIVVGLTEAADFDYAFGTGQVGGTILLPTTDRMAFAGRREEPRRFQARLRIVGPATLTPEGATPASMRGLEPRSFRVTLRSAGTGAAYPATIVNASYVSGEYWLVVAAPEITNPADGDLYDLEVCICPTERDCAYNLVNPRCVLYGDIQFNQMLVLDRSYSMHYPEPAEASKIEAARNAARIFADAAADADRLGLATFTGNNAECNLDAALNRPLRRMNDGGTDNRTPLINAINAVVEAGWTSIGDGLKVGRDALLGASPPPGVRDINGLVLLSDGLENEGDFWAATNPPCAAPPVQNSFDPISGPARSIKVDTIAFGANADQELLQRIASFTRGTFYAVSADPPAGGSGGPGIASAGDEPPAMSILEVANRLAHVHRSAQEELRGHDRLYYRAHNLKAGDSQFLIPVTEASGGGVRDANFSFNWPFKSVGVQVRLFEPGGAEITGGTPGWRVFADSTHQVFQFGGTLPPGDYEVRTEASAPVQLLAMLSGQLVRGVNFSVVLSQPRGSAPNRECFLPQNYDYLRGLPVEISANVADVNGGIPGLRLVARVENPDGSVNRLSLYDDGLHDNGVEGDGIYGNRYTRTPFFSRGGQPDFPGLPGGQWGGYTVHVFAAGKNSYGERFERFGTRCFQVTDYLEHPQFPQCDPDTDNDGIPDRWEVLYGLNPNDPADALLDYDVDGLSNKEEFHHGTLPFNPDTDGGGEHDGSEVGAGRDPLFDQDDELPAILDYGMVTHVFHLPIHEPEPNTLILRFPVNPAYRFMEIWRFDWLSWSWQLHERVDLDSDRSGIFYDRGLDNGTPYFYALVAEGHSGARTPATMWFWGVPKDDPVPPTGSMLINHGDPFTASLAVTLSFSVSPDTVEFMASEDPAFTGATWQPFTPATIFLLAPRVGPSVATVYARFRDAAQNESIVEHDSILLEVGGDADNDGLQDSWEIRHWGHLGRGPNDDPDGDRIPNGEEFRNGWDPTDPLSPQRVGILSIRRDGNDVIIEYDGLLRAASSVEGPYQVVPGASSPYRFTPTEESQYFRAN